MSPRIQAAWAALRGRNKQRRLSNNSTPVFPLEIFGLIIDFLHDDTQALFAASLVCSSWIPFTRFHIPALECAHITARNEARFLVLISSRKSTIVRYLRALSLGADSSPKNLLVALRDANSPIQRINIILVEKSFPVHSWDPTCVIQTFPHIPVVRLCLRYLPDTLFDRAIQVICSLSELRELELELTTTSGGFPFTPTSTMKLPYGLRKLSLTIWPRRMPIQTVVSWLEQQQHCPLKALELRIQGPSGINPIIRAFGKTVEELTICMEGPNRTS